MQKNTYHPLTNKILGKWQETQLIIHESNGKVAAHDTIFTGKSFAVTDYIQFNVDDTVTVSQSWIYATTGESLGAKGGSILVTVNKYAYSISDSTLSFKSQLVHSASSPSGLYVFQTKVIIQLDADHLVLRTYYYSSAPLSHSETAYYSKIH